MATIKSFEFNGLKGNTPITYIISNIEEGFKNSYPKAKDLLNQYVKNGYSLHKSIAVIIDLEPLKTPIVNIENGVIYLSENYLAFLWGFTYYSFVLSEEHCKSIRQGNHNNQLSPSPLLNNAKELFDWSLTLAKAFSNWPNNLPNPKPNIALLNPKEEELSLKTNNLFVKVICNILFHELSHCILKHRKKDSDYTQLEKEKDADNLALYTMLDEYKGNSNNAINLFAISIARTSSLFLISYPSLIKQIKHPDLDLRVLYIFDTLDIIRDEEWKDTVRVSIIDLLYHFFNYYYPEKKMEMKFEKVDDCIRYFDKIFSEIKNDDCIRLI